MKTLLMAMLMAMLMAIAAMDAIAATWNCSNPDMEIGCSEGKCEATFDAFTPMDVAFNDDGALLVCAYSGCWEGDGEVLKTADFLAIAGHQLSFSTDPVPGEMRQDVAILLDLHDNVALLKSGGYAQPLLCVKRVENDG